LRNVANVFDGSFRLHVDGKLIDAGKLPSEVLAGKDDESSKKAKERLSQILKSVDRSCPAPPLTFPE
jgi:hypothetical protein